MRWITLLWCRLRGHKILHRCDCGVVPRRCATCIGRKLDAAYEPDAYTVGEHLWGGSFYGEVVVERISRPTTLGSKAWLMTRRIGGGRYGAPDTEFSQMSGS